MASVPSPLASGSEPTTVNQTLAKLNSTILQLKDGLNSTLFNNTTVLNVTRIDTEEDVVTPLSPMLAILLLYGILFLILGAQMGLYMWKVKHKRSYELVTLFGLWLMPAIFSFHLHFWRFLATWMLFTCVTGFLLWLCHQKHMARTTPRKVYTWFLGVYKVSVVVGITGYALLILEIFGIGLLLRPFLPADLAIDLLWYGLYFGILGRDCAEVASDNMASSLERQQGRLMSTVNNCGVCGNALNDDSHLGGDQVEKCVQLACKHCFHELCIRGWVMVGKKQTCPVCREKVDMSHLYADRPWETKNLTWIQMLDGVRYLVVWNPIIFFGLTILMHWFAPHHHEHHHISAPVPAALGSALG